MQKLALRCRCGVVSGSVELAKQRRVVCYCDDCQVYARYLGRTDTLDACGGSDALITAPGCLRIESGRSFLRCLRLSPRGIQRWYAACCNTPIANMISARVPFVSLLRCCVHGPLRPAQERVRARFALAHVPDARQHVPLAFLLGTLWFMLRNWRALRPFPFTALAPHVVPSAEVAQLRAALPAPRADATPLERVTLAALRSCG